MQIPLLSTIGTSSTETSKFSQAYNFNNSLPNEMTDMYLCSSIDLSLNWNGTFNNLKRHLIQVLLILTIFLQYLRVYLSKSLKQLSILIIYMTGFCINVQQDLEVPYSTYLMDNNVV